jgi:hypothetical protein
VLDCITAATVKVVTGTVDDIWAGIVAPTVSSTFAPWDGVVCGLCCKLTFNDVFSIDAHVGLDGGSLLRVERTISGSFFLLLKNRHNKHHRNLNKSTNHPTGRANLFTLDFGKLMNWFKTRAGEINQQISRPFIFIVFLKMVTVLANNEYNHQNPDTG